MSSIGFSRVYVPVGVPVFSERGTVITGGFTLDSAGLSFTPNVPGPYIPAGTPMYYNEATRLAKPLLGAKLQSAASATDVSYNVLKGHNLVVGMNLTLKTGAAAYPIQTIVTTNALYDTVTLSQTLGVAILLYNGSSVLVQPTLMVSSATGPAAGAYMANGLLLKDTPIDNNTFLTVIVEATVYGRRCILPSDLFPFCPRIIVSQSF